MKATSEILPSLSIMIVEDDKDSREILTIILRKRFPDLKIYTAINGREGLALFEKIPADIIISDVNMPVMGGIEMCRAVREIKPETRIMMITADTGKAALDKLIGKGFMVDHYILKPVEFQKLFVAVQQCIEEISSTIKP